ncbi:MAG TPA: ABC transporter permease subunit [Candidatus Limnocylindrales bacterium]|nr:ABC transporter permease subunit [Candidatus Limnocylindrales bacterium]
MTGLSVLLRKELLEQWRTLRLPVIAAVFVLIGLSSPLLARFTPELIEALGGAQFQITLPPPTTPDAVDQLIKNVSQFGILVAVLLAMGSVATEKERGTAGLILTKPASRGAFLLAKLVAIGATLLVSTLLAAAAAWVYTLVLFEALPVAGFAASALLQWLALMTFAAITFLGSTLTRSALAAAGIGVAAFILIGVLSAFPSLAPYLPVGLGAPARALALGIPPGDVAGPVLANAVLIAAMAGLSWLSFRRQEL